MENKGTVVAVYDNFDTANKAIKALVEEGFARSDIGLAANNAAGEYNHLVTDNEDVSGGEGGGFGAVVGGITGAVVACKQRGGGQVRSLA